MVCNENPFKSVFIVWILKTKLSGKQSRRHTRYNRFNSVLMVPKWAVLFYTETIKEIKTKMDVEPLRIRIEEGGDVILPCTVYNLKEHKVT